MSQAVRPPPQESTPQEVERQSLVQLRQELAASCSYEELRTLCFDLGVTFDDLPGEGITAKARELVAHMERQRRIPDLVDALANRRSIPLPRKRLSRRAIALGALGALAVVTVAIGANLFPRGSAPVLEPGDLCLPSAAPVRVDVAQLEHCPAGFRSYLAERWAMSGVVGATPPGQTLETQEALTQPGYDLAVRGECDERETVRLTYELVTTRKPDEAYEPASLVVTGSLTHTLQVGLALISYQHGDYRQASQQFEQLLESDASPDLAFLRANSLLFAEQYQDAVEAYEQVLASEPGWAAVYNNLGLARFNKARREGKPSPAEGLADFEQAIRLAKRQGDTGLALLAYTNRSDWFRRDNRLEDARADCQAAMDLDAHSALPYICLVLYDFARDASSDIGKNLDKAQSLSADPPAKWYYLHAEWYRVNKQPQLAQDAYAAFFDRLRYRACLEVDRRCIQDAIDLSAR